MVSNCVPRFTGFVPQNFIVFGLGLGSFRNQSRAKASGTDLHSNRPSLFNGLHLMEVRVPDPSSLIISVAHIMTKDWTFSADFTYFSHFRTSK